MRLVARLGLTSYNSGFSNNRPISRLVFQESPMTIDKSLRRKGRLSRSRNVLKREERILQLKAQDRWEDGQSPLGLPKVRVIKTVVGKKKKKKAKEDEEK